MAITLEFEDYPALFRESSICAQKSQQNHYRLFQARISLLLAYAVLGAISWTKILSFGQIPQNLRFLPLLIIAASLAIALIVTALLETKKYDKLWFSTRIIAENVKKETWLFIMKANPYHQAVSDSEAKKKFLVFLKNILASQPSTCSILTINRDDGRQITKRMDDLRNGSIAERRDFYIKNRIHDQQAWYSQKAKTNISKESRSRAAMWILQALAVIFAFMNIVLVDSPVNLIGIATTSGTALLSWNNSRNFRELSQSYGYIAQELSIFEEQAKEVTTEKELAELVSDVEAAISKEQISWKAKK